MTNNTPTPAPAYTRAPRALPVDHWARDEFPASDEATYSDKVVMQGHADYCAQYGHATVNAYYSDDVCGRCEERRTPVATITVATPTPTPAPAQGTPAHLAACGVTGRANTDHCDVCGPTHRAVWNGTTTTRHQGTYDWTLCTHHVING